MFREANEAADNPKNNLLLNLLLTFWILVMQCLMLLELSDLKMVSKMFNELVKHTVRFEKILRLMNSICDEFLWRKIFKENLFLFKNYVSSEFKNDQMLQLYIKCMISSFFSKFLLYRIFSHFSFCKRTFDKDIVFC